MVRLCHAALQMALLPAHDKVSSIVGIAVSGNKKYVACTEIAEDSEGQQVSVYSLQNQKRIRTLTFDAATAQTVQSAKVVCINFRCGGKDQESKVRVLCWHQGLPSDQPLPSPVCALAVRAASCS